LLFLVFFKNIAFSFKQPEPHIPIPFLGETPSKNSPPQLSVMGQTSLVFFPPNRPRGFLDCKIPLGSGWYIGLNKIVLMFRFKKKTNLFSSPQGTHTPVYRCFLLVPKKKTTFLNPTNQPKEGTPIFWAQNPPGFNPPVGFFLLKVFFPSFKIFVSPPNKKKKQFPPLTRVPHKVFKRAPLLGG